jgi:ParB family transcriptional regulator, chromosome partitioning protein
MVRQLAGLARLNILETISISRIKPAERCLRQNYGDLTELMASISEKGLIEPIIVRPMGESFEIVCGHRRFEACKKLGLKEVLCVVCQLSDQKAFEVSLIENLQRESLDPIDEAEAYKKYVVQFGWGSITRLSKRISKSQEYVSHRILLLNLPKEVIEQVTNKSISSSKAKELVWLKNEELQNEMASALQNFNLPIRKLREAIRLVKSGIQIQDAIDCVTAQNHNSWGRESGLDRPSQDELTLQGSITVLRVAMSRYDSIIEQAKSKQLRDYLIKVRYDLHQMVDESLRKKKEFNL